jgi:predicted N-formylglutamate amidohydrolase
VNWLLTCEHYANTVPLQYQSLFNNAKDVLDSHRGYDKYIAPLYESLKDRFDASFHYPYTRLLIEPNRSLHHRHLFSPFSIQLSKNERMDLITDYYQPYRNQVIEQIKQFNQDQTIHISVHSFTASLGNQNRTAPIGLLFDSRKKPERAIADIWKQLIRKESDAQVRFNYPYRGAADGFTTFLRKEFKEHYLGFELEVRNDCVATLSEQIISSITELRLTLS